MPIYEYRCDNGHTFEVMQSMTDEPVAACRVCDEPAMRVFRPVSVHFKGSGFYTTDYGRKRSGADSSPSEGDGAKSEPQETASTAPDSSKDDSSKDDSSGDD